MRRAWSFESSAWRLEFSDSNSVVSVVVIKGGGVDF